MPVAILDLNPPVLEVDGLGLRHQRARVALVAQHGADRICNVARVERGGGDLIQQGLEEVVVAAIDDDHVHVGAAEIARGAEAGEPAADHDCGLAARGGSTWFAGVHATGVSRSRGPNVRGVGTHRAEGGAAIGGWIWIGLPTR